MVSNEEIINVEDDNFVDVIMPELLVTFKKGRWFRDNLKPKFFENGPFSTSMGILLLFVCSGLYGKLILN